MNSVENVAPRSTPLRVSELVPSDARCKYQEQDSTLTLSEGLEEYYRVNAGRVLRPESLSPESRALFRSHDMCHVAFGLTTSLSDETLADTRTLFSCDVGFRRYVRYLWSNPDAKALFEELGWARIVWITMRSIPRVLRAIGEVRRMHGKWPWEPPPEYLAMPLTELRRKYGIRVI